MRPTTRVVQVGARLPCLERGSEFLKPPLHAGRHNQTDQSARLVDVLNPHLFTTTGKRKSFPRRECPRRFWMARPSGAPGVFLALFGVILAMAISRHHHPKPSRSANSPARSPGPSLPGTVARVPVQHRWRFATGAADHHHPCRPPSSPAWTGRAGPLPLVGLGQEPVEVLVCIRLHLGQGLDEPVQVGALRLVLA